VACAAIAERRDQPSTLRHTASANADRLDGLPLEPGRFIDPVRNFGFGIEPPWNCMVLELQSDDSFLAGRVVGGGREQA
jgi:hypothetical protein